MVKKIISLTEATDGKCLIYCDRVATVNMKINRVKYDDSIVSFHVCDQCLAQMQKDIETHE